MDPFETHRRRLIAMLRRQGIRDEAVLAALERVRREAFVPSELADEAYDNVALPIGLGQTISQPYVVALMSQELQVEPGSRVLEVGTGSGYQAAVLAELGGIVVSVERVPELREAACRVLARLGYTGIELHQANGSLGWERGAPYDRIIVTAGGPNVPAPVLRQLAMGGRLVMPIGTRSEQELVAIYRTPDGFERATLGGVRFVPLLGAGGWPE